MSESLAVKYRPEHWEEVVGQSATVRILKNQVETGNIKNCYGFFGSSGCGKTTIARIFANYINDFKGHPEEYDAATNNSADDVKDLISKSRIRSLDSKYKVIIIDECHSITTVGWQAFLKSIEEPVPTTIFIFCTTNPEKIPATVLSRIQVFNFTSISDSNLVSRLSDVITKENESLDDNNKITVDDDESLYQIVRQSAGSVRQSIANLEKVISYSNNITKQTVCEALGSNDYETMFKYIDNIMNYRPQEAINVVNEVYDSGHSIKLFIFDTLRFVIDLNKKLIGATVHLPDLDVVNAAMQYKDSFMWLITKLSKLYESIKYDPNAITAVELTTMMWCIK